jgi:hypothetical protein
MQSWAKTAIDEGRFAAAGSTEYSEEAVAGELVNNRVNLALASEEQMLFVFLERPESGKRIAHTLKADGTHLVTLAARPVEVFD